MNLPQKNLAIAFTLCITLLAFFPSVSNAQNVLEINITNIKKNKGKIVVEIYDNKIAWLKTPFQKLTLATNQVVQIASFKVPYGSYAITIYQDVNNNGEADMNFIGIPREPVGFGNNYKPFGEPKYEKALIQFNEDTKPQEIKL